jgi:hypothetical protein
MGSIFNISLAASIAEIISAYPVRLSPFTLLPLARSVAHYPSSHDVASEQTCGGVYSASAWLVPKKHRAITVSRFAALSHFLSEKAHGSCIYV